MENKRSNKLSGDKFGKKRKEEGKQTKGKGMRHADVISFSITCAMKQIASPSL